MNDYERIALVIRYLDEHHIEQPDLATLAEVTGLSSFYFHRLFHAWAGITPKDFLQCITLAHAKELLREGESVLDAALEAGLSSPCRLHDLCVSLESASPGDWTDCDLRTLGDDAGSARSRPFRRDGRGAESVSLSHSLSSRHSQNRCDGRVSVGAGSQTRDTSLGEFFFSSSRDLIPRGPSTKNVNLCQNPAFVIE